MLEWKVDVVACSLCVPPNRFLFVAGCPQNPDLAVPLGALHPTAREVLPSLLQGQAG